MDNTVSASTKKKSGGGKVLAFLIVLALIVLIVILDMRRRQAEQKYQEISMKYEQLSGNPAQNREAAQKIVEKVKRLYAIPEGIEPTVATIVDVDKLRQKNAFYDKAKNGDNLIVTQDRAILYDPVADKIIDVVPVQIQPQAQAQPPAADQASSAAQPTPPADQPPASEAASSAQAQ